jgi:hypothetical protein
MTVSTGPQKFKSIAEPGEIVKALRLICPGRVTEVRALDATMGTDRYQQVYSGYFNDPDMAAEAIQRITTAKSIYFVPNDVNLALLARAENRIRAARKSPTTSDHDIVRRRWLLIDVDPKRPADVSSDDIEHEAAIVRCIEIRADLRLENWPDPILADSGNGAHLMYPVDLPVDDQGLIERCLKALAHKYDNDVVSVDQTVFNPARIWKLYGTMACKGDSTADRPHRMARMIEVPDIINVVPVEFLEALAEAAPQPEQPKPNNGKYRSNGESFDIAKWIREHNLNVRGPDPWKGGERWVFDTCPWNSDHTNGSAYILRMPSGAIAAGCHHNGCSRNDWHTLRDVVEPGWNRRNGNHHQYDHGDRHQHDDDHAQHVVNGSCRTRYEVQVAQFL